MEDLRDRKRSRRKIEMDRREALLSMLGYFWKN
jgi:hypothetical protein